MTTQHPLFNGVLRVTCLLLLLGAFGCAESESPTENPIQVHPESWTDPASEDFHGEYIANLVRGSRDEDSLTDGPVTGVDGCASCHGDFGAAAGDQCLACHSTGNETAGHPPVSTWLSVPSDESHIATVAEEQGGESCQTCHGLEFDGGWSAVRCQLCHPYQDPDDNGLWSTHPPSTEWLAPSSSDFHANTVATNGPDYCTQCHGVRQDDDGGWVGDNGNCYTCHAGPSGHPLAAQWIVGGGHATASNGYYADPTRCESCHGSDLTTGGTSGVTCADCHSWPFE